MRSRKGSQYNLMFATRSCWRYLSGSVPAGLVRDLTFPKYYHVGIPVHDAALYTFIFGNVFVMKIFHMIYCKANQTDRLEPLPVSQITRYLLG